jgi:dihydroneopterin aldolase
VFLKDYVAPVEIGAYAHEHGHTQRVRFNVEADVTRINGSTTCARSSPTT